MGKNTALPKIEEANEIALISEDDNTPVDVNGNEIPSVKLSDIYISGLNEFGDYAAGKLGFPNLAARQEKVLEFVKLLDNLLLQEYGDVKTCLKHFLVVIGKNKEAFISGSVFATLYTLNKVPYGYNIDRFVETVTFFSTLQDNLSVANRFVSGRDLPSIFKNWHPKERDNLIMFANSYNH